MATRSKVTKRKPKTKTRGDRNIEWIESHLCIPEGKFVGQPVRLTKQQKEWIKMIYDTPTRRFILSMARKNAKTTFTAFLLLLHLVGYEARKNSQLYSAAQSREQAAILFELAAKMVRMSPDLESVVVIRDTAKQLLCPELGTVYKALSADASTAYGLSPVFSVHDELGQVKGSRSQLYEAIETASGAQDEPLSVIISTQAPTDADLLSVLIDDAKKGKDPKTKLVLYTADEDLDPFGVKAIKQANPHYEVFMNKDEVLAQAQTAKRMPSAEAGYRNLILNQRVNANSPLVTKTVWMNNADAPDEGILRHAPMVVGLDLSARNDLTAFVGVAQDDEGFWHVDTHIFTPHAGLNDRAHRDREPYDVWVEQGYIHALDGNSVNYEQFAKWIVEYCEEHNVVEVMFDRWRIDVLKAEFEKLGVEIPLTPFGQGFGSMSPAIDVLETVLMNGQMKHGAHPVLTMCARNATATRNPAGERKMDKSKATGRIDGMVALAMAMAGASKRSNYDDEANFLDFLKNPVGW